MDKDLKIYQVQSNDRIIKYQHIELLGTGAKGQVFLINAISGFAGNLTGPVAMKTIVNTENDEEELHRIEKEALLLSRVNHPNILKYIDCFKKKSTKGVSSVNIITEYCEIGNLESLLNQCVQNMIDLDKKLVVRWMTDLAHAIHYLHSLNIIHRDIKPQNILFKKSENNVPVLKLCDFGLSRYVETSLASSIVGTRKYASPEIRRHKKYHFEVDVWSYGVVLFQVLLRVNEKLLPDVEEKIQNNPNYVRVALSKVTIEEYKPFIDVAYRCLKLDAVQRPTAKEICDFLEGKRKMIPIVGSPIKTINDELAWHIRNFKAKEFWDSSWKGLHQITWIEFFDSYKEYLDKLKDYNPILTEHQQRGLKKLVSITPNTKLEDGEIVSAYSFDKAVRLAGFPFDTSILAGIDQKYSVTDAGIVPNFSKDQYLEARKTYLQNILQYDSLFVDPVSNAVLNVAKQCISPDLCIYEPTNDLKIPFDWDNEGTEGKEKKFLRKNSMDFLLNLKPKYRIFILGQSASGKTCLMRLLFYKLAEAAINDENLPIPILIPVTALPREDDEGTVVKCIKASAAGLNYSDEVFAFLQFSIIQKNAVFLFDGLDEAGSARPIVEQYIIEMHREKVPGIVVTSRSNRYDGNSLVNPFMDFIQAKLLPLSIDMQIELAMKRGLNDAKFDILKNERYSELCRSPFLLSMMVEFLKANELNISPVRANLYEKAMDSFIEKYYLQKSENEKRSYIGSNKLKELLMILATHLHQTRSVEFTKEQVAEWLKSKPELKEQWDNIVEDIDKRHFPIIENHRKERYRFMHLSFQEYWVSRVWARIDTLSIIRRNTRNSAFFGTVSTLTASVRAKQTSTTYELDKKKVGALIIDPWYRDTFYLCAGQLNEKDFTQMVEILLDIHPSFSIIRQLLWTMIKERTFEEQKQWEERIKKEKFFKTLISGLASSNKELREIAKQQLITQSSEAAQYITLIIDLLHHKDKQVRAITVKTIKTFVQNGMPPPIEHLLSLVSSHCNEAILQCLSEITSREEDKVTVATEILKHLFKNKWGDTGQVRLYAIALVIRLSKRGDPQIISDCMSVLRSNQSSVSVRYSAFRILRDVPNFGDSAVIKMCLDFMKYPKSDHDVEESSKILMKLVDKGDYTVLSTMIGLIIYGKNDFVRQHALNVLAAIGHKGDYRIIQRMLFLMKQQHSEELREGIVKVVSTVGKNNQGCLQELLQIMLNGEWYSRECASLVLYQSAHESKKNLILQICNMIIEDVTFPTKNAVELIKMCFQDNQIKQSTCLITFLRDLFFNKEEYELSQIVDKILALTFEDEEKRWIADIAVMTLDCILREEVLDASCLELIFKHITTHLLTKKYNLHAFKLLLTLLDKQLISNENVLQLIKHIYNLLSNKSIKRKKLKIQALEMLVQCGKILPQTAKTKISHEFIIPIVKQCILEYDDDLVNIIMNVITSTIIEGDTIFIKEFVQLLKECHDEDPIIRHSIIRAISLVAKTYQDDDSLIWIFIDNLGDREECISKESAEQLVKRIPHLSDTLLIKIATKIFKYLSHRIAFVRLHTVKVCKAILAKRMKNKIIDDIVSKITKLLSDEVSQVRHEALGALEVYTQDSCDTLDIMLRLAENADDFFKDILRYIRKKRKQDKTFFSSELYEKLLQNPKVETDFILMELVGLEK